MSAIVKLKDDPGRRVLLVFTDGADEASRITSKQTQELTARTGVSIFAIRRDDIVQRGFTIPGPSGAMYQGVYKPENDPLTAVAEVSGGMVMEGRLKPLGDELVQLIGLIRDRYIVDFVRPTSLESGMHSIDVSIGSKSAFVRVGGTTVPLPDPAETNDPDRVPADKSVEPPVGTRRVLKR